MRRVRRRRGGCIGWLQENSEDNVNFEEKNFLEVPVVRFVAVPESKSGKTSIYY